MMEVVIGTVIIEKAVLIGLIAYHFIDEYKEKKGKKK